MKEIRYTPLEGDDQEYKPLFYKFQHEMSFPAEVPHLIPGILPRGGVTLLSGPPKEGKSDLAAAWAYAVASGTPFAGEPVEQGQVLWLDFEQTVREKILMLSAIPGAAEGEAEDLPLVLSHALPGIDTHEGQQILGWYLRNYDAKLIVVDSLWAAVDESNVSRPRAARQALGLLGKLCAPSGATVLVIHHTDATGKRPSASTQLQAACGVSLVQSMDLLPGGRRIVHLRVRGRGVGIGRRVSYVSDGPGRYRAAGPEDLPVESKWDESRRSGPLVIEAILALFGPGEELCLYDIAGRMEMVYNTARLWTNRMVREGKLRVSSIKNGRRMYVRVG